MIGKKRLLIFKTYVGKYRVDFLNDMYDAFDTKVWLKKSNTSDQAFIQQHLFDLLHFRPHVLPQGSLFKSLMVVRSELREYKPDVVITTEFNLITICVLLFRFLTRKKYKVISMTDDSYNMITGNDFTRWHRVARRCVAPFLDDIISVEPRAVEWYQSHYHKGFFFPIICNEKNQREDYMKSLNLLKQTVATYELEEKHVILFVGRLVKLKNLETLIKAYAKLNPANNQLIIVGDGEEVNSLRQLSMELGVNVLFTGILHEEALNVWYNIAHTFVLPSYQECFGAVTNEALLAGCYAVVSERAGSQCLIKDGINGYVFETYNVDDLTDKLNKAKQLPTPHVESDGLRKNLMLYDYSSMIKQFINHINTM